MESDRKQHKSLWNPIPSNIFIKKQSLKLKNGSIFCQQENLIGKH